MTVAGNHFYGNCIIFKILSIKRSRELLVEKFVNTIPHLEIPLLQEIESGMFYQHHLKKGEN